MIGLGMGITQVAARQHAAAVVAPTIALSSVAAQNEGASGTTAFVYTLTLTRNGSTAAFPYTWAVTGSGSSPADASDFGGTFPSGSGTFATGETSKTITVLASGDAAVEPDETFLLAVTSTGAGTATATGTILNDDSAAAATMATRTTPYAVFGTSSIQGGRGTFPALNPTAQNTTDQPYNMLNEPVPTQYVGMTAMKWVGINSYGAGGSLTDWRDEQNSGAGIGTGGPTSTPPSATAIFEQLTNTDPYTIVVNEATAGRLGGRTVFLQAFGANQETSQSTVVTKIGNVLAAVPSGGRVVLFSAFSNRCGEEMYVTQCEFRMQKYMASADRRPNTYYVPWHAFLTEWNGPEKNPSARAAPNDDVDVYHNSMPTSLSGMNYSPTSVNGHCNGIGFGPGYGQALLRAVEGCENWPFAPPYKYFGKVSGLNQVVCNIEVIGDMTGWTPTCLTSGFSVAIVAGVLKLSTVGAAPAVHRTKIQITWSHATKASRTDFFWASVSSRAVNALPAIVRRDGRVNSYFQVDNHLTGSAGDNLWPSTNGGEITVAFMVKFEEDNGLNPIALARQPYAADARVQDIVTLYPGTGATTSLKIQRNASAGYNLTAFDNSSATSAISLFSKSGGTWGTSSKANIARGWHAFFLTISPSLNKWQAYITAGDGTTPGLDDATATGTLAGTGIPNFNPIQKIAIAGDYGIDVNGASATSANGQIKLTGSINLGYFQGQMGGVFVFDKYMDVTDPAVRALFWNSTTKRPAAIANEALTGIYPTIPLIAVIGDAAEIYRGDAAAWNEPAVGLGKNHGSLKAMMSAHYGIATTL